MPSLVRTHTHSNTKPLIALNRASVWSVSVSAAPIRHHSSCILTTIQSNSGLRDWARTLLHGDGCYHGNRGGVWPANKPKNAALSCFSPRENIKFVLVCLSLLLSFFLASPHVEECLQAHSSLSLTILRLVGNHDVPQLCRRFLPSVVSPLHSCFLKQAANTGEASFPHGAVQHADGIWLLLNYW